MGKGLESVEKEIAAEKAAALGNSGRKLKAALDQLQQFDEGGTEGRRGRTAGARTKLIESAGEALWSYIVQREAIGLVDAEYIRKEYAIPADVWQHMSPRMEQAERERLSPGSGSGENA